MAQQQALQNRLNAVFGALSRPGEETVGAWQPSAEQVFRAGTNEADREASSDEEAEYEERARREVVPGLAMDLAVEDEPDAEGFRPSAAFCRAIDREDDYNDVDELATGTYKARRPEARPPRNMEVLDDNIYEQKAAQHQVLRQEAEEAEPASAAQPAAMETDTLPAAGAAQQPLQQEPVEGGEEREGVQQQQQQQRQGQGGPSNDRGRSLDGEAAPSPRSALASGDRPKGDGVPKRVRFEGVAQPWVPPHRRENFTPRDPEATMPPSDESDPPRWRGFRQPPPRRQQRGAGLSLVPDHVQHPERYTLYTLDEPLVVGGGLGQLGAGAQEQQQAVASASQASQGSAEPEAPEPERWQGTVGGGIEFRPRTNRGGTGGAGDVDMGAAGSGASSKAAAGAQAQGRVQLAIAAEEGEADGAGAEEGEGQQLLNGSAGGAGGPGGDAEMLDAGTVAAQEQQQPGQFNKRSGKGGKGARGYRSKAAASEED